MPAFEIDRATWTGRAGGLQTIMARPAGHPGPMAPLWMRLASGRDPRRPSGAGATWHRTKSAAWRAAFGEGGDS